MSSPHPAVKTTLRIQPLATGKVYLHLFRHSLEQRHALHNVGPHLRCVHCSRVITLISPDIFYPNGIWIFFIFVHQVEHTGGIVVKGFSRLEQYCNNFVSFGWFGGHFIKEGVVSIHVSTLAFQTKLEQTKHRHELTAIKYGKVWFVLYASGLTKLKHPILQGHFSEITNLSFWCP